MKERKDIANKEQEGMILIEIENREKNLEWEKKKKETKWERNKAR